MKYVKHNTRSFALAILSEMGIQIKTDVADIYIATPQTTHAHGAQCIQFLQRPRAIYMFPARRRKYAILTDSAIRIISINAAAGQIAGNNTSPLKLARDE